MVRNPHRKQTCFLYILWRSLAFCSCWSHPGVVFWLMPHVMPATSANSVPVSRQHFVLSCSLLFVAQAGPCFEPAFRTPNRGTQPADATVRLSIPSSLLGAAFRPQFRAQLSVCLAIVHPAARLLGQGPRWWRWRHQKVRMATPSARCWSRPWPTCNNG